MTIAIIKAVELFTPHPNGFQFAKFDLDIVGSDKPVGATGAIKQTDKFAVGDLIELRLYLACLQ
jgi:hypothetical protein